tara:strand:+ start:111 stop:599 length:489 start_codon:yes stop_codon:yes gene_type:complete
MLYKNERLVRSLERVVRCLSNLSEDFHNAFWNYIMMSTETFVAYGEYAWCVVIGASSMFLAGCSAVESSVKADGIKSKIFKTVYPYKIVAYSFAKGIFSILLLVFLWYIGRDVFGINAYDACKYWCYSMIIFEIIYVSYSWKLTSRVNGNLNDTSAKAGGGG